MRSVPIAEVADVIMGQAPAGEAYNDREEGLPLIAGASDFGELTPTPSRYTTSSPKRSRKNDIILCVRATIGDLNWSDQAYCLGRGVAGLRVREGVVDRRYLWRALEANAAGLRRLGRGATFLQITRKDIAEYLIALPPLPEQRRIAAILDQADALRRLRRQSLSRLSDLGQAIFFEMFGDPALNPKCWPVGTIRDLLSEVKYGTAQKANSEGRGLPILRMGNLTYEGQIDLSDLKHVELPAKDFPKYTTCAGDLLFNRTNSKELVGKTAVVEQDEPLAIAGYLIRARTNKKGNPHYISAFLNSTRGKAILHNMCKNIVGMANINAQEMQDIPIAVPPIELQDQFASRLAVISDRRKHLDVAIQASENLFASLQHRAFRGEL